MNNVSKVMAGVALLAAVPVTMTVMQPGTQALRQQAPQYATASVLASLDVAGIPDHNVHSAGCGCAACQGCQVIDSTSI